MIKNPESWTDEEKESYVKLIEGINDFGQSIKPYNIDTKLANNTTKNISDRFYKELFIKVAILEAFFIKEEISFKELNQSIYNYVPRTFRRNVSINFQNLVILKMIRLGFIEVIKTQDKYMPNFKITLEGVKIYKEQQLQNIAVSSFFSYHTKKLNIKILWLTILMLIVTVCSVIATILSLIK